MGTAGGWALRLNSTPWGELPRCPVPQASIFAVCLQCSLHHLMSGALAKPKIAQSRPGAPPWLPLTLHSSLQERSVSPRTRRGWKTWILLTGRQRASHIRPPSSNSDCRLLCTYYVFGTRLNTFCTFSHYMLTTALRCKYDYSHLSY